MNKANKKKMKLVISSKYQDKMIVKFMLRKKNNKHNNLITNIIRENLKNKI